MNFYIAFHSTQWNWLFYLLLIFGNEFCKKLTHSQLGVFFCSTFIPYINRSYSPHIFILKANLTWRCKYFFTSTFPSFSPCVVNVYVKIYVINVLFSTSQKRTGENFTPLFSSSIPKLIIGILKVAFFGVKWSKNDIYVGNIIPRSNLGIFFDRIPREYTS